MIVGESGGRGRAGAQLTVCRWPVNECRKVSEGLAPKWSGDGMRIYFLRPTARGAFDLWSATRDGEDERKITTLGQFRLDEIYFDVSQEGRIIWAPIHTARQELWLSDFDS
jgi:hypothetical protein